jgi:predicted membrane metal-binding protein
MEKIREVAIFCVGRAVMFGSLAITCVMVGFSFNPVSAFRSGAVLTLLMAAVLIWKAYAAAGKNPRTTEVWIYLDDKARPADEHSRFVFATVMRDVYGRFGQASLAVACLFFAISVVFVMFGFEAYQPQVSPHTAQAMERAVPE